MTTKVRPLHDRVIVRRLDEEEKSAGGIIIPDSAKEKPVQGAVIAVGKGTKAAWPKPGQLPLEEVVIHDRFDG